MSQSWARLTVVMCSMAPGLSGVSSCTDLSMMELGVEKYWKTLDLKENHKSKVEWDSTITHWKAEGPLSPTLQVHTIRWGLRWIKLTEYGNLTPEVRATASKGGTSCTAARMGQVPTRPVASHQRRGCYWQQVITSIVVLLLKSLKESERIVLSQLHPDWISSQEFSNPNTPCSNNSAESIVTLRPMLSQFNLACNWNNNLVVTQASKLRPVLLMSANKGVEQSHGAATVVFNSTGEPTLSITELPFSLKRLASLLV